MMHVDHWLNTLLGHLQDVLGSRLIYVGLGGSYARGEATDSSDIDVNTVLDTVSTDDLMCYRSIVRSMPKSELACGFIAGIDEIKAWPTHELFQFLCGTKTLQGSLNGIVSFPSDNDIRLHIRITASTIYHLASHTLIYGNDLAQEVLMLKEAYKSAFFALQELVYLKTHKFVATRRDLLLCLDGLDHTVLQTAFHWNSQDMQCDNKLNIYTVDKTNSVSYT